MQVFAVFAVSNPQLMIDGLNANFEENYYFVEPNTFFVATTNKTTRQLSDAVGLTGETNLGGIVIPVTSYWGRENPDIWEWINIKMNANG